MFFLKLLGVTLRVNLVKYGYGKDLADAGDGAESEEVAGVLDLGFSGEDELKVLYE